MTVQNLIFDMDKTLYPATIDSQPLFDARMCSYLQEYAGVCSDDVKDYQNKLVKECGYDINMLFAEKKLSLSDFHDYVCDIDVSFIKPNPELKSVLASLPQRKYIFTDSNEAHVDDCLNRLGLDKAIWDGIFVGRSGDYLFKFSSKCFHRMLDKFQLSPAECLFFEDTADNLRRAKELGMGTVLISDKPENYDYVDYKFNDVVTALKSLPL